MKQTPSFTPKQEARLAALRAKMQAQSTQATALGARYMAACEKLEVQFGLFDNLVLQMLLGVRGAVQLDKDMARGLRLTRRKGTITGWTDGLYSVNFGTAKTPDVRDVATQWLEPVFSALQSNRPAA
jgi:hypothetical protein